MIAQQEAGRIVSVKIGPASCQSVIFSHAYRDWVANTIPSLAINRFVLLLSVAIRISCE